MPTPIASETVEREIIALYLESNASVNEIKQTYNLTNGHLYSILRRHNILRRTKQQRSTAPLTDERAEELTKLETPANLEITTDANGFVQSVERTPAPRLKRYMWDVRFESVIRIEAETIVEAISEVQKLPMCKRVFNVALKGAL